MVADESIHSEAERNRISMNERLLIIVPAYNEADSIRATIEQIKHFAPNCDYVIVNDGSSDQTLSICESEHYNLINLPINVGLTYAVKAGMMYAYEKGYDFAMQFDGDGQHDARFIDQLLNVMISGECDIAIGSRYLNTNPKLTARIFGGKLLSVLIRLIAKQRLTDPTSGMRLYSRNIISLYVHNPNINPEPDTMSYLIRCGVRVKEVPVEMRERVSGESKFTPLSSLDYMIRIAFSLCFVQWFRKRDVLL